eukprot:CAMPEP_0198470378 /NCGR_PEP_ID=MMETSP1456-20131121/17096_1 /TAXON_ID=1461544 ORGANISM="Unidentified sp., Strain RCC1871" /NCGR_SAMPLE_ID=MMETSP1456 /ASSEMBLY_ACC=CAM_ASM_001119 /LENGTH=143 /DNA_ID=CAMNT_0044196861 /DNA_START=195 /DNA_END=625 /DNA_ORIENTATION=+
MSSLDLTGELGRTFPGFGRIPPRSLPPPALALWALCLNLVPPGAAAAGPSFAANVSARPTRGHCHPILNDDELVRLEEELVRNGALVCLVCPTVVRLAGGREENDRLELKRLPGGAGQSSAQPLDVRPRGRPFDRATFTPRLS